MPFTGDERAQSGVALLPTSGAVWTGRRPRDTDGLAGTPPTDLVECEGESGGIGTAQVVVDTGRVRPAESAELDEHCVGGLLGGRVLGQMHVVGDRKCTRLNSSH